MGVKFWRSNFGGRIWGLNFGKIMGQNLGVKFWHIILEVKFCGSIFGVNFLGTNFWGSFFGCQFFGVNFFGVNFLGVNYLGVNFWWSICGG